MEGPFDGFVVETGTEDPKRRGMFVLAMENCTLKGGLELGNGKLCDVIGDFVCVCWDQSWWQRSVMVGCGMEGRPFRFVHVLSPSRI